MRRLLFSLLVILLATGFATARPFTNKDGKTIDAEIAGATATTVTLKLKSGKKARIKIETLSEPDQKFVKAWMQNRVPRLRVTPKLVRSNRDDESREFLYLDDERQTQLLTMAVEVENEDSRIALSKSEMKYILVGRSVANRKQYKILAVQKAEFEIGVQGNHTIQFKPVKNTYDDGDYGKSGHRCIGYVLHAARKDDGREVYSYASTPVLEKGVFNIIGLKAGTITDENFIRPGGGGNDGGSGIIVVE